ncbi:MAG: hypothetical protein AAFV80_12350 [Bacteroidota bacterium]
MSNPLQVYTGIFSLKTYGQLQQVPSNFEYAQEIQHLCDYIRQRKGAALDLQLKKGQVSEFVDGRLFFTEEYQYRVYAIPLTPHRDLEGIIYWGKAEITFSTLFQNGILEFYIHALPPDHISLEDDFYVFQCTFERYQPKPQPQQPKQQVQQSKYPIDQRLVGHWRHSDRYGSGGFSSYTETNMFLAADGTFWRQRRSFTTSTFSDQFGNWAGMGNTDSGNGPKQTGVWGVVDGKFFLLIGKTVLYNREYEVYPDSLFFQLNSGKNELWKR